MELSYIRAFFAFLAVGFCLSPAHAEWHEASSDHFVIYADEDADDIRDLAVKLEKFHAAMNLMRSMQDMKPSPSNRLTLFIVKGNVARKLSSSKSSQVRGFYLDRAGEPVAVVSFLSANSFRDSEMFVLLRAYAMHEIQSRNGFNSPIWLRSGSADFFASATFDNAGNMTVGGPANARAPELFSESFTDVRILLEDDPKTIAKRSSSIGGESWLLYHYLVFNEERKGQLQKYAEYLAAGETSISGAEKAFGDLKKLNGELSSYLKSRRMSSLSFVSNMLPISAIEVRKLNEPEQAVMQYRIPRTKRLDEEQAQDILSDVRKLSVRYPENAAVLTRLAKAEYDVGDYQAAVNAADRALVEDPERVSAYIQKGKAMFRMAALADDRQSAYAEARQPFLILNRLENDHPLPLLYYFLSFEKAGIEPSQNAIDGLSRALELAPYDPIIRIILARALVRNGQLAEARKTLLPLSVRSQGGLLNSYSLSWISAIDLGVAEHFGTLKHIRTFSENSVSSSNEEQADEAERQLEDMLDY